MSRSFRRVIDWVGSHGGLVLLAMLLVVGGSYAFMHLVNSVRAGTTRDLDEWTMRQVEKHDAPGWLQEIGRDVTALGGPAVMSLTIAAVVGYLLIQGKHGALCVVLVATLGAFFLSLGLKYMVDRERPDLVVHREHVVTQSFPSGHSMVSAVVYLTLGSLLARIERSRIVKVYLLSVAVLLTFLVGVSRVYMGVHWPTDVLAGWSAGLAWALLVWLVTYWLQWRGAVEADEQSDEALRKSAD